MFGTRRPLVWLAASLLVFGVIGATAAEAPVLERIVKNGEL